MKYIDSYKIFEAKKEVFDEKGIEEVNLLL